MVSKGQLDDIVQISVLLSIQMSLHSENQAPKDTEAAGKLKSWTLILLSD